MKLVINNDKSTITVFGSYAVDDVLDEIARAGLNSNEWVIEIIPSHYWTQNMTIPSFLMDYEIKA